MTSRHRSIKQDIIIYARRVLLIVLIFAIPASPFIIWAIYARSVRDAAVAKCVTPEAVTRYEAWVEPESIASRPARYNTFAKVLESFNRQAGKDSEWDKLIWEIDDHTWPDTPKLDKARELCASSQELISQIKALANGGGPFYPLDFSKLDFSKGIAIELPHLKPVRDMSRLLWVDAVCKSRDGATDEAVEDIICIMRMGDAIASEPLYISSLVRIWAYSTAEMALMEAFPLGKLLPEQANRIIEQVRRGLHRQTFAWTLKKQMFLYYDIYEGIRTGEISDTPKNGVNGITDVFNLLLSGPRLDLDEAATINMMDNLIILVNKPYYEISPKLILLQKEIDDMSSSKRHTIEFVLVYIRSFEAQARHEAILGLIETGLLVEQRIAQTGAAPDSLTFVGGAATDPFTGKPFAYKPDGAAFTLYSLGPDQEDDGGIWKVNGNWRDGDIPWRGNR